MNARQIAISCAVLSFCASLFAQGGVEKVVNQDGKIRAQVNGTLVPMKAAVAFPGGIVINTNGGFKAGQGKERKLEKGEAIAADGMLQKPDGSVSPVADHYISKGGRVYVVKDGGAPEPVTQNVALPDGSVLSPDSVLHSGGRMQRLLDGQTLRLDGNAIPTQDSVTLKSGKVTVQKDGALFPVTTSITMNDGSKVLANGTVISFDGKTRQLKDGETITLPGAVLRR
ncbi:MAG TPA: DUF6799 domain-containing protein [Verrucomicrobiae bacterium]|nr:DUF6799 domain-containing protein [Verrucomicrobiae bacterium]